MKTNSAYWDRGPRAHIGCKRAGASKRISCQSTREEGMQKRSSGRFLDRRAVARKDFFRGQAYGNMRKECRGRTSKGKNENLQKEKRGELHHRVP